MDKNNEKNSMSKEMSQSIISQNKSNKSDIKNVKQTDL